VLQFRSLPQQDYLLGNQLSNGLRIANHALRPNTNPAGKSGLWHSALKFGPLTIAVRGMSIFFVAIRLENTAICQYSVTNLSKRVESSSRHFISINLLFDTSSVLPGPEQACPPLQQKFTAIRRKYTAISYFFNIPLLFRYFTSFSSWKL
jgi:hypothetical protein